MSKPPILDPDDYHVAWIAPLDIEYAAATQMLDDWHQGSFPHTEGRQYIVTPGHIGNTNIIVATLASEYGNVTAANLTSEIRNRFPKIQLSLLVGVAAGLPLLPDRDIRLGDILVAVPSQSDAGIVAYDIGKTGATGFDRLITLAQSAPLVRSAFRTVQAEWPGLGSKPGSGTKAKFQSYYDAIKSHEHNIVKKEYPPTFARPGKENDTGPKLPVSLPGTASANVATDAPRDRGDDQTPRVWYGSIGTGEKLVKDASNSLKLRDEYDIIGLEMEAYGSATGLQTGVIRGVCDYADENKNKMWQPYAAAVAAAYAKTLLVRVGNLNPNRKGHDVRRDDVWQSQTTAQTKETRSVAFTVPFDRASETLVQRPYLYDSISKSFESNSRVVLWGLGGVGKSRAAIEVSYRTANEDRSRAIFWISAASATHFVDSIREIFLQIPKEVLETLEKLNSSAQGDDKTPYFLRIVKDWLSSAESGPWMIFLDNADTSEIFDKGSSQQHPYIWYIPRSRKGRVLMTTRNRNIGKRLTNNEASLIEVTVMTPLEAVEFFRNHLPADESRIELVEELAALLDYLPLAIKQAIVYIQSMSSRPSTNVAKYLVLFKKHQERLLQRMFFDDIRNSDLPIAVVATWQLNFTQIQAKSTRASNIISCLAVLDREAIPTFLLAGMIEDQEVEEDIGLLAQYSFVVAAASPAEKPDETVWSVHRLVHLTMQFWLRDGPEQNMKAWKERALSALSNAFISAMEKILVWKIRLLLAHARLLLADSTFSPEQTFALRQMVSKIEHPTWLSASKERSDALAFHNTQIPHEGTCEWILCHERFLKWLEGRSQILFIRGMVGSGKTTTCSRVIRHLYERHASDDTVRILYYYGSPGGLFSDIIMTFLSQLCSERDDLPEELRLQLIAVEAASEQDRLESTLSALKLAINTAPGAVFIVVDGYDEIYESEGSLLEDFLASLRSEPRAHRVRVLVTGRWYLRKTSALFVGESEVIDIEDHARSDVRLIWEKLLKGMEFRDLPDSLKAFLKRVA